MAFARIVGRLAGLLVSSLLGWGYALLVIDWKKESNAAHIRAAEEQAKAEDELIHAPQSLYG